MGIRRVRSVLVAALACLALAGCAAPEPVPTPIVLAQGQFQDAAGNAGGLVEISKLPDVSAIAVFSGVTVPGSDLILMTADRPIEPDQTCLEAGMPMAGPGFTPGLEDTYILDPAQDEPDEVASFVLARETGAETGCLVEIVAHANLQWAAAG